MRIPTITQRPGENCGIQRALLRPQENYPLAVKARPWCRKSKPGRDLYTLKQVAVRVMSHCAIWATWGQFTQMFDRMGGDEVVTRWHGTQLWVRVTGRTQIQPSGRQANHIMWICIRHIASACLASQTPVARKSSEA